MKTSTGHTKSVKKLSSERLKNNNHCLFTFYREEKNQIKWFQA